MSERNCFVLLQYREDSEYNDFLGKFYHFPRKYLKQLSNKNIEFVYYEPKKRGEGVYYGTGKIGRVFNDKREEGQYFAEIYEYRPFSIPVPFFDLNDRQREIGRGYNAQNAIRSVEPSILDEICLDGGVRLNFTADAHLIQVLGEQLIASERVGILELIKNSFDAGSSFCNVVIDNVPEFPKSDKYLNFEWKKLPGPVIIIEDGGKGMDRSTIENGWLRPASRMKTNVKSEIRKQRDQALKSGNIGAFDSWINVYKSANKGRLPLGEKGVGRFATHRLGKELILKSKIKEHDYEFVLHINWDDFDEQSSKQIDLSSIGVTLFKQPLSRNYGEDNSGTQLIIYGGRNGFEITKETIQEIYDSIQSLNSPFKNPYTKKERNNTPFKVNFDCPQLIDDLKTETIYDIAPPVFVFDGIVNEHGELEYELDFNPPVHPELPFSAQSLKGRFDLRASKKNEFTENSVLRNPNCGPFFMHVDVWYRTSPWISTQNVKKAAGWLSSYGGIALYRDFVNLFPADWGANYDWLQLSKRHIEKGTRISYYNMYGYVEVFQDSNLDIVDKTDRQGLLENKAFADLSSLVKIIVENFIEKEFQGRRNDFTTLKDSIIREPKEKIERVGQYSSRLVENIINKYDIVNDPLQLLIEFNNDEENSRQRLIDLKRSLENLEKSVRQISLIEERLVENAGFGLSAAVAIHELAKITSNFYNGITQLINADKLDKSKLNDLRDAASSLKTELKNLSPLRSIKNEPVRIFNISRAIDFAGEFYKRTFEKYHITFSYNKNEDFTIIERFGTICQIFTNMIDNSVYWLDTDIGNHNRRIEFQLNEEYRTVKVADNGPGIEDSILPYLYQPGASMKNPPSGLGLYICQYYMNRMKGQIGLTNQRSRIPEMKGAQFTLDFSRVPK